jgi:hypothetical protein
VNFLQLGATAAHACACLRRGLTSLMFVRNRAVGRFLIAFPSAALRQSMEPTITILTGAPVSGSEGRFLRQLYEDLAGTEALILANFVARERQIDFVVVTAVYAAMLELKTFPRPMFGERNGDWEYLDFAGKRVRHPNPYQQAVQEKYHLSDEMKLYRKKNPVAPGPSHDMFYEDFDAFVCVYPEIHRESRVTPGDHKIRVRSYVEIIDQIRSGSKASSWSLSNWRDFAERHLRLTSVTLGEATDPKLRDAHEKIRSYCERVMVVFGSHLPPLTGEADNPDAGPALITRTLEPCHHLLLGPSGSAKTFHLHHVAVTLAGSGDEIPIFIEAKNYRGGNFAALLKQATAPFFRGEPVELLQAVRLCGLRPVLLADALNECTQTHLAELMRGIQTFAFQFEARLVLTSQGQPELPADLQAITHRLPLPDQAQKRTIYAHHAGLAAAPEVDGFCSGFTNCYDLTLAGLCHKTGAAPGSRTELYDRYVRRCLPGDTNLLSALLRHVAGQMSTTLATAWSRDLFDTTAECFLREQQATVAMLDELKACRLIQVTDEMFSFEHELLFDYFKAEDVRRRFSGVNELVGELKRPRNERLLELVLPRYSEAGELQTLFAACRDVEILHRVCAGAAGPKAMAVLLDQCVALLDAAAGDVPRIEVNCVTAARDDGRRWIADVTIAGSRAWTEYEQLLCKLVAQNLDHPKLQQKFLELLDLTEWTLRAAAHAAARRAQLKPHRVWEEMIRLYGGTISHGKVQLPCVTILSSLRFVSLDRRREIVGSAMRDGLLERTRKDPESHFSLGTLLQDRRTARNPEKLNENLRLVEQALNSRVYILQVDALEYLQMMSDLLRANRPEDAQRIVGLLKSMDGKNLMLNSCIFETLAAFDELELSITADDALAEMRELISLDPADPKLAEIAGLGQVSPAEYLAQRALGCLDRIFEDVFQGIYWDAYSNLSDEEKGDILRLAGQARDCGFTSDWILNELFRYGGKRAVPVYQRFATGIDGEVCSPQEEIARYILGIRGCARWTDLPPRSKGESPEHEAWQIIGEILFWRFRDPSTPTESARFANLWERFEGPVRLAGADVFYQLSHLQWRVRDEDRMVVDLIATFPGQVCSIFQTCLAHHDSLPSVFRYGGSKDERVVRFMITTMGSIADLTAIPLLQTFAEDAEYGREAVDAIEAIQKRRRTPEHPRQSEVG